MASSFRSRADTRVAGGCIAAAPAGLSPIPNTPSTMPRQRLLRALKYQVVRIQRHIINTGLAGSMSVSVEMSDRT
jgi:hypothetical protein